MKRHRSLEVKLRYQQQGHWRKLFATSVGEAGDRRRSGHEKSKCGVVDGRHVPFHPLHPISVHYT